MTFKSEAVADRYLFQYILREKSLKLLHIVFPFLTIENAEKKFNPHEMSYLWEIRFNQCETSFCEMRFNPCKMKFSLCEMSLCKVRFNPRKMSLHEMKFNPGEMRLNHQCDSLHSDIHNVFQKVQIQIVYPTMRNDSHFNSHSRHLHSGFIALGNGRIDAVETFMFALLTEMETFASVAFYSW